MSKFQRMLLLPALFFSLLAYTPAQTKMSDPPISWQYTTTQGQCKIGNNRQGPYLTVHYSNFAYTDPSTGTVTSLSGTVTGYYLESSCISFPEPGTKPSPDPLVLNTPGGQYDFVASGLGGGSITLVTPVAVSGFINPKYVIVGVTYAPPGPSSFVQYTNSTTVGNTTSVSSSFSSADSVTVTVTKDISAWSIVGGAAVKVANSASTSLMQASSSSSSNTLSQTASVSLKTNGTGNAFSPVNHDYDIIWLWLNPLFIFSVEPNSPNTVIWNGYGYDSHDPSGTGGPDIFPVYVGDLNGDFGSNPSISQVLARGWVTTTEPSLIWPSGAGPGLNSTDIANILTADPFSNPAYSLPTPLPATSADGRFTQVPYPPNPIAYIQAGPGNGGGLTTIYSLVNTAITSTGQSTSYQSQQTFSIDSQFSGGTWFSRFTLDVKQSNTLTWSQTWQQTLTTTKSLTDALSITGPGCPQTTPPCVPAYTGPAQFITFQDNQYGTFMFYPAN
jgi:hypothetical protein